MDFEEFDKTDGLPLSVKNTCRSSRHDGHLGGVRDDRWSGYNSNGLANDSDELEKELRDYYGFLINPRTLY